MKLDRILSSLIPLMLAIAACAQTPAPSSMPASAVPPLVTPRIDLAGPPPALDPKVVPILKALQDRPATLKDFTGKIDYTVYNPKTDDTDGKTGTIDFLTDKTLGPQFTADFTVDTKEGKPFHKHHTQVIFDGHFVIAKDFDVPQFVRTDVMPPGSKPGDAITLNGAMPLPIGLDVNDVARNFAVTIPPPNPKTPATADQTVLQLIPRMKGKFDFTQLTITVDHKLQLPIKMIEAGTNGDITTILLDGLSINTGQAKMESSIPPPGWTERGK